MPLFSKSIKANGLRSDIHPCLNDQLVSSYVEENGFDQLHGYLEAIVDLTGIVDELCKKTNTLDELKSQLKSFSDEQMNFVNRTDATLMTSKLDP